MASFASTSHSEETETNVNQSITKASYTGAAITLGDLVQTYQRRRRTFYGLTLGMLLLAGIYCAVCTRRYDATGVIQVQKESPDGLGLDNIMSGPEGAGDALNCFGLADRVRDPSVRHIGAQSHRRSGS